MIDQFDPSELSEAGARRREEILKAALRAASRRRIRVQLIPAAGAVAAVLFVLFLGTRLGWVEKPPQSQIQTPIVNPERSPSNAQAHHAVAEKVVVTQIRTDPTLLDRLSVPPQKPTWKILTDDQLLRALADAGRPAGLEYDHGQVVVLYRDTIR